MSVQDTESARRKRVARCFLILALLAMRGGDFLLFWYLILPGYASAPHSGAIVGSFLWTTALFVGVWLRHSWARYVLITFNCAFIALFTYPLFVSWGQRQITLSLPSRLLIGGVLLYVAATT